MNHNLVGDIHQVTHQDAELSAVSEQIFGFLHKNKIKERACSILRFKDLRNFTLKHINPLLESGQLEMTIPDKPKSRNQKYITVHFKLYSHHLPIHPILDRKFQTLHLAQQPDRSQRQPHRANQKCHNLLYLTTKNWVKTALVWSNQVKLYQPV